MWRFNLERGHWWGGFFIDNAKLTVDELTTVLEEIEGTLNARPLTDEYEECEGEVLTPNLW
jgi:hypothetical protein